MHDSTERSGPATGGAGGSTGGDGSASQCPEPSQGRQPSGDPTLVAVDTGGTFTDLVAWHAGRLSTLKVPSTPDDPSRAILLGIRELIGDGADFVLLHGTTVATNALLERKGSRVALVTNAGFTDVLAIGRQNRPQLYALVGHREPPLVPRELRIGVSGRLGPDGAELEPIDATELAALAGRISAAGAEAVAICLLHAYADPAHERAVADALSPLGLPLSISSVLLPEYREYERTSTTVVNAYVAPVMSRYLGRLARESHARRVEVMGSNGGTLAVERALREPAHTVLSGPAGGVVGALAWALRAGFPDIATFDMGGTSTDVALCPGRPQHTREFAIDGHPVALPVIDIHTVGAGGGSLAEVDAGGALRVGPASAGAVPGPICYRRGGQAITVTDAHVWLGRLPVDAFLELSGGLDREAVRAPLEALARELGTTPDEAAEGVLMVADAAMERALRVISVERGHDPAGLALVAFGGAGALHAAGLAGRMGMKRALIPPDPGLLSAWGILTAPVTREASRTLLAASDDPATAERVEATLVTLADQASADLVAEGVDPDAVTLTRLVDARYRGQSFELRVAADPGVDWIAAFHAAHAQRYGYRRDEAVVEAVTCRAIATGPGLGLPTRAHPEPAGTPRFDVARVVHGGTTLEARRCRREHLAPGTVVEGPALILEDSATTWVPPEWMAEVDVHGILHLLPV